MWKGQQPDISIKIVPSPSVSSEGRVELLGGGSLQISNLTEADAGVYTCMADNSNATIEVQAQLTIQGILNQPQCLLFLKPDA